MNLDPVTEQIITERAATESGFAIAAATEQVAYQIKCLGTGTAATEVGTIEYLAGEIKSGLLAVSEAINQDR